MNATRQTEPPMTVDLRLRSVPDANGVPATNRLRRLCKAILRGYGFRLLSIADVPSQLPPVPPDLSATTGEPPF